MPLDFPTSPSNGDEYQGYTYDSTDNVWNRLPNNPEFVRFSETAPSNPQEGTMWFDTTVGKMYVYYDDGTSAQWISMIGGLASQQGTEGQMLIHDGNEWIPYDGSSRNLIYNGAMQVHQRGTSSTGITGSGYYTADRWNIGAFGAGTWTQTVENDGPTGSGFRKSLKMLCTTANSSLGAGAVLVLRQNLEGQDVHNTFKGTSVAKSLTLSFWVKSNVTGTYIVNLLDLDNTRTISASYSVASSGVWEKKTFTFSPDTTGQFDNDNAASFRLTWYLAVGTDQTSGTFQTTWGTQVNANNAVGQTNLAAATNNYWQITGVQFEVGSVATPFEFKPYGQELAECQRYYYRTAAGGDRRLAVGYATGTTDAGVMLFFPVSMRIPPTALEQSGTASHYGVTYVNTGQTLSSVPTFVTATNENALSNFRVTSGLTAGQGLIGYSVAGGNGYLAWSAEL